MNKDTFNQLEIQQQVEYINQGLELNSLTKVCEAIGIDRATVRKRFKSKGFELVNNRYINTVNTVNTTNAKKITNNTSNTKTQQKSNKSSDIKALEKKIESLEAQIKGIIHMINTNNTVNTNDTTNTTELKKYKGTTVSRNYRVNEEVQKEFKKVCNKFTAGTDYTVTDIISLALEEFMNKHN